MATDTRVRTCLQDISRLDLEIKALIQDIRQNVNTTEDLALINGQARMKINQLRRAIKDLESIGCEQVKSSEKAVIQKDVGRHAQSLTSTVQMLRQVSLTSQMAIDKKMKDDLISGGSNVRQRSGNTKESLVKSAGNVTESLMSISSLLSEQVDRSRDTVTSLASSSKVVSDTHSEFKGMRGHIHSSRKLLTKYGRRELTDKLIIILALCFFFACVLYIVKKRLWT